MIAKTVVELFAGVGGFRVGLNNSVNGDIRPWEFVWANQWEPSRKAQDAFNCYIAHFGNSENHVNGDINTVEKRSIPAHNLLVGGFPCQDYSVARTGARGIQGKKGVLWWSIYETIREKNPRFVLLENVDRLLKSPSSQRGRDFGIILACFNMLGYSVEWRIINAADYGFAQRRRRIFIFAFRNDTVYARRLEVSFPEWIHNYGFFQAQFPVINQVNENNLNVETEFEYDDLADVSDNFSFDFLNSGVMSQGRIYSVETTPINIPSIPLSNILTRDVEPKYYLSEQLEDWKYLKGAKRIERTSKTGHQYIFSEGAISFPDPLDRPARTMLTSEASKNRSTHVVADLDTGRLRLLTPIEAERLNGFPDNWTNTGMSERFRYFCMGNALVVGVIEKMGIELNNIFENEE